MKCKEEAIIISKEGDTIIESLASSEYDTSTEWLALFYHVKGDIYFDSDPDRGLEYYDYSRSLTQYYKEKQLPRPFFYVLIINWSSAFTLLFLSFFIGIIIFGLSTLYMLLSIQVHRHKNYARILLIFLKGGCLPVTIYAALNISYSDDPELVLLIPYLIFLFTLGIPHLIPLILLFEILIMAFHTDTVKLFTNNRIGIIQIQNNSLGSIHTRRRN